MFTLSMTLGAKKLVEKGVLVTKLSASENASTMNSLISILDLDQFANDRPR
jgi:magnesium-transporting ATPase (P-type)